MVAQLTLQNLAIRYETWKYLASSQKAYLRSRSVDHKELINIIKKTCDKFDCIYFVVDAADEFRKFKDDNQTGMENRGLLLTTLKELQKYGNGKIKILVTSRPAAEIQKALLDVPRISIDQEANSHDIELYVRAQLEKEVRNETDWGNKLNTGEKQTPTLISYVVAELVKKANGM